MYILYNTNVKKMGFQKFNIIGRREEEKPMLSFYYYYQFFFLIFSYDTYLNIN